MFEKNTDLWQADKIVLVQGKGSTRGRSGASGEDLKIMVDEANELTVETAKSYQDMAPRQFEASADQFAASPIIARVYIRLASSDDQATLLSLKQTIDDRHGDTEVVLVLGPDTSKQVIKLPMKIQNDSQTLARLTSLVGADNVRVK